MTIKKKVGPCGCGCGGATTARFNRGHQNKKPLAQKLAEHTDTSDPNACWVWGGAVDRDGYGRVQWLAVYSLAHRVVYAELVGAIAEGMELDHLCRNRPCVNPAHLEPVTRTENNSRMWAAVRERKAAA